MEGTGKFVNPVALFHLQEPKLTSVNNFSEEIFAPQKVPRRTVPPSVPKLELALHNGLVRAFRYRYKNAGVLPNQAPLFPPKDGMNGRIHVQSSGRLRE
jgi:hypothetical protein